MTTIADLDEFTRGYVETALWAETDDDGEPFDKWSDADDIAPETLDRMAEDCARFQAENSADLEECDLETAGHDFWLTRNGHGAGFWDGDYPQGIGDRLTESAHAFGEVWIYRGDDRRIYS